MPTRLPPRAGGRPVSAPGRTCATGLAALKKRTKINYDWASGPMDFRKYHNVPRPWDVMRATAPGSRRQLTVIIAAQVCAAESKVR